MFVHNGNTTVAGSPTTSVATGAIHDSSNRGSIDTNTTTRMVLAESFVQQKFRIMNEVPATTRIPTTNPPVLNYPTVSLTPPVPVCYCQDTSNGDKTTNHGNTPSNRQTKGQLQHNLRLPLSFATEDDFKEEAFYAIQERLDRLKRTGGAGATESHEQQTSSLPRPTIDGGNDLPTVDNDTQDMKTYTNNWRKILGAERRKQLLLYERYSQYNHPITRIPSTASGTPVDNGSNTPSNGCNSTNTSVSIRIKGLADAKPTPAPGDLLLIRPLRYLSLPSDFRFANQLHTWSQPVHVVEIVSTLQSVVRDKTSSKRGDQLVATWLETWVDMNVLTPAYNASVFYNIRILPNGKPYRNCLTALDWADTIPSNILVPLLFPHKAPTLSLQNLSALEAGATLNEELNHQQISFVRTALARTLEPSLDTVRGPLVLTGPAGTGKTKTMLAAIVKILESSPHNRILVCTPSHTAANVITARLASIKSSIDKSQIFRLLDSDRPVSTIPISILQFCQQDTHTGAFSLPEGRRLLQYRVIVCTCNDANILYCLGLTNQQIRHRRRCFENYIRRECEDFCMSPPTIPGAHLPHFTHFYMDEAAQATEPESLICLSDPEPGAPKVEIALVGDPRQLSPSVYSTEAAKAGLERSWMERLLQRPIPRYDDGLPNGFSFRGDSDDDGNDDDDMLGPTMLRMDDWLRYSLQREGQELSHFLTLNYRGHVSFLMVPSALFYADRLQRAGYVGESAGQQEEDDSFWCQRLRGIEMMSEPLRLNKHTGDPRSSAAYCPAELCQQKQFNWPIHFRGVIGTDTSDALVAGFASDSWCNKQEAEVVTEIIVNLAFDQGVPVNKIGVMAPFRGQVALLRQQLRAKQLGGVNVGTIEDYQSVEHDVIVLSLTRSSSSFVNVDKDKRVGVFGQPKRSNVALTRAEHLMIVVGNPKVMVEDFVWRQFLWFCLRNGLWYGETGGVESSLGWDDKSHRDNFVWDEKKDGFVIHQENGSSNEKGKTIVVVSSLERLHRLGSSLN